MNVQSISPIGFQRKANPEQQLKKFDSLLDSVDRSDSWEEAIKDPEILNGFENSIETLSKSDKKGAKKFANALMLLTIGLGTAGTVAITSRKVSNKMFKLAGKYGDKAAEQIQKGLNFGEKKASTIKSNSKLAQFIKSAPTRLKQAVDKSADYTTELSKYASKLGKQASELTQSELEQFGAILNNTKTKNFVSKAIGYTTGSALGINTTVNVAKDENKDGIPDKFQQKLGDAASLITLASLD